MLLHLLLNKVMHGDLDLFLFRVATQLDHFHTVAQCGRDRIQAVGGGDEEHVAQVERCVQVVIAEAVVLLRVQHLKEG